VMLLAPSSATFAEMRAAGARASRKDLAGTAAVRDNVTEA